jgi:hypothetical protein
MWDTPSLVQRSILDTNHDQSSPGPETTSWTSQGKFIRFRERDIAIWSDGGRVCHKVCLIFAVMLFRLSLVPLTEKPSGKRRNNAPCYLGLL